ncbi:transposase IS166 family protein [Cereibacter ovatus]|uniref:Transposase IS166 family protein n=1 Tax=Cereibacter ovatus TaxID=439529 RepID=A0A285D3Y8_9RHOB|nr:transposase IS166 family protein [Cereibacter ovatus]
MSLTAASLPDDPAALKAMILQLQASLRAHDLLVQSLRMRIARLKRQAFGKGSEKIAREIEQLEFALESLQVAQAEVAPPPEPESVEATLVSAAPDEQGDGDAPEKAPRRRPRVSPDTPRERRELDPGETCPDCGGALRLVSEDVSQILDMITARLKLIEVARPKKSCVRRGDRPLEDRLIRLTCEKMVQCPAPTRPICEACGGVHHEHEKPRLLEAGEWRATAEGDGRTAGFHLSALYSPWETWAEIAAEHGRVRKDPPRLQVWVNTKLGESWEDQAGDTVPADPLMARREDWGEALPASVAVLTAGVDVQGDRIEVQILGWGRDEEAWVIDYRVLWGDPSGPRLWSDLDMVLQATFPHPAGLDLPVRAAAIDTGGHHTKMAYEFCRTRLARRIWAIKGRGGPGIPVWPRRPTRTNKGKIPLFIVGVDAVKDAVYARLRLTEPCPGAIHFPRRLDADYFRQLTAERVVTRFERGRPIRSWQPKRDGERNEALDTFVYAHAALHGLISMGLRLNEEVERVGPAQTRTDAAAAGVIRSAWMTTVT